MAETQHWTENRKLLPKFASAAERKQVSAIADDEALLRNYYQRPVTGREPDSTRVNQAAMEAYKALGALGFNLSREVIDASAAQLCDPIGTKVTPVGADHETRIACKQLSRLTDAIRSQVDAMALKQRAYKDACTMTLGATKLYVDPQTEELKAERAHRLTLYWDDAEGSQPLTLYQISAVPKLRLARMFPEHGEKIMKAPRFQQKHILGVDAPGSRASDSVKVIEAWSTADSGDDGMHAMQLADGTELAAGDWQWGFFPFAICRWDWDHEGFGGVPLGRILAPYHYWTNRLVLTWYKSLRGAVPRVLLHENSEVDALTDQEFEKVLWSGQVPPTIEAANTVPSNVPEAIEALRMRAYAEGGINPQAAAGARPPGLNSAPAQREWIDIASTRLKQQKLNCERYDRQFTEIAVALMSVAYKKKPARVRAPGSKRLEQIKFPDLKEGQYEIDVAVTSGLSQTISGRMEQANMLEEKGKISSGEWLKLVGLPDTESASDRANAPQELAESLISRALDHGEFKMPMAWPELLEAIIYSGTRELMRAYNEGEEAYPRDNTEALRRLIAAAEARMPPPAPAPLPAPAPAAPLGPPAPPAGAVPPPVV